ncbi:hypothetical protein B0H19DRAFT_929705, partial [Mycena capillaripes]
FVGIGGHSVNNSSRARRLWRMWDATLDRIRQLEVVLANATVTTASLTENPVIRGSSSSFDVVIKIVAETFPAPNYAVAFDYAWNLDYATAAPVLGDYQIFVNNIPTKLALGLLWTKVNASGFVNLVFARSWYGAEGQVQSVLQPFLDPTFDILLGNGTWIENLAQLNSGQLNTSLRPETDDTFYVKSLVTPQEDAMKDKTRLQFMKHFATEGFSASRVC